MSLNYFTGAPSFYEEKSKKSYISILTLRLSALSRKPENFDSRLLDDLKTFERIFL